MNRLGIVCCACVVSLGVSCSSSTSQTGTVNGHEWVDLGVSVKWASCNVGAASPEEFGDYFAWGETSPKNGFEWSDYKYRVSGNQYSDVVFSKYNTRSDHGVVDDMVRLEADDDAAVRNWGGTWRMPTPKEWSELVDKCIWTWSEQGGRYGYVVTSKKNGRSIFLPAAGSWLGDTSSEMDESGLYWSSCLENDSHPTHAYSVNFSSLGIGRNSVARYSGLSVRPVTE